jgi:hypothetical protein
VYNERELILVSPGFPFSNTNENVDFLYYIRPSSPDVCALRILFKLFWVGEKDSYAGCSGGFLQIDGHHYCDCIIGLTVISRFDDLGDGRQKVLRYRKDAEVRNSGGFLLEVFQEDCTGRSPWSRQDTSNETDSQNEQHYNNIPYYYNVGIGSSYATDRRITGQRTFTSPCTDSRHDDKTNRSHDTYFNKQNNQKEQDAHVSNIPCKISNRIEITDVYSTNHRDEIYGNESAYSRRNNSGFQESNTSATDNGKNNSKIQHNLNPNIPHENRSDIHNNRDTSEHNFFPQEGHAVNNSDKQIYKFNLVHKNNSFADESNVTSADTENHLSNCMTRQVSQNNRFNIFSIITNTSSLPGKDMSENITKYCDNINADEGKPNASSVTNTRKFDLTSIQNDVAGSGKFTLNRNESAHTTISQYNGPALNGNQTAKDSGRRLEVTTRERRNVVYSQYRTDRLWSSGESACRIWGFAQWLLRVKQYFWNKVPQLLCPLLPSLKGRRCQVFSQATGWLRSPGHPQPYPHNLRLCYR